MKKPCPNPECRDGQIEYEYWDQLGNGPVEHKTGRHDCPTCDGKGTVRFMLSDLADMISVANITTEVEEKTDAEE